MAAAAAETVTEYLASPTEEYGQSLVAMRCAGQLLVSSQVNIEYVREQTELYFEFKTAVVEMLKNDPEHKKKLELNNRRSHRIIDGQVVNANGEPMVDVLQNGIDAVEEEARKDKGYECQLRRDKADKRVALKADSLEVGQTLIAVSKDPAKALAERPDIYDKRFGYVKGLLYVQTYSKVSDEEMKTGSYSIDCHDPEALRRLLTDEHMDIAATATDEEWIDAAEVYEMSSEEAEQFVQSLRKKYSAAVGESSHLAADEYAASHEKVLKQIFDTYYPDLSIACVTGVNQPSLHGLARSILEQKIDQLKSDVRRHLIKIANSYTFDDESVKTMNAVIRYAAVEHIRKNLKPNIPLSNTAPSPTTYVYAVPQQIHTMLAQNIRLGVSAGRSYPGCPGNINMREQADGIEDVLNLNRLNPQEAYGGQSDSVGRDKYGSRQFKCPKKGCLNTRQPNTLIEKCQKCGADVRCK